MLRKDFPGVRTAEKSLRVLSSKDLIMGKPRK